MLTKGYDRPARFKAAIAKLGIEIKNGNLVLMEGVDAAVAAAPTSSPAAKSNIPNGTNGIDDTNGMKKKRKAKDAAQDSSEEDKTVEANKKAKTDGEDDAEVDAEANVGAGT